MAKKREGLSDRLNNLNKKKENRTTVSIPKPVIQEAKITKKPGRPTYKQSGVQYERIFTDVPKELKNKLKLILLTKYSDVYKSQSELILAILEDFVNREGEGR